MSDLHSTAVFNVNIFFYTVLKYISSPAGRLAYISSIGVPVCVCSLQSDGGWGLLQLLALSIYSLSKLGHQTS